MFFVVVVVVYTKAASIDRIQHRFYNTFVYKQKCKEKNRRKRYIAWNYVHRAMNMNL